MTDDLDILAALEQLDAERVWIVRVILAPDGRELGRIRRGHFNAHRDSHVSEPQHPRETSSSTTVTQRNQP